MMSEADFTEVAEGVWRFAADGGPNSGVVIGEEATLVVDGQPNAAAARAFAMKIAALGAPPVEWVALTHFHASRWAHLDVFPGAALIASRKCRTEMLHRGAGELAVAHLRDGVDLSPGGIDQPPAPRLAFKSALSVFLGARKVELLHFGRGHTSGDAALWVQDAGALFTGDLVETEVAPFIGDASAPEWIATLDRLAPYRPRVLIPGRGPVAASSADAAAALRRQRSFIETIWRLGARAASAIGEDGDLEAMITELLRSAPPPLRAMPLWKARAPFAAARLLDAARGGAIPAIWTADKVRAATAAFRKASPYDRA